MGSVGCFELAGAGAKKNSGLRRGRGREIAGFGGRAGSRKAGAKNKKWRGSWPEGTGGPETELQAR